MRSRLMRQVLGGVSSSLLMVLGAGAQQVTSAAAGEEAASKKTEALEEIIVTARKREETVRDIPTSINAFTGDELASLGYRSVEDILRVTPGVTFESGLTAASTSIIVRGVTSDSRSPGPRTVGRFYGDIPLSNPSVSGAEPDLDVFDMRTVEVLKGPQGTLFGASALAGALRYEPNLPEMGKWGGAAGIGGGTMASSEGTSHLYELMFNMPLGERFALRFAGSDRYVPGYIDDARSGDRDFNDYRAKLGRVMAGWEATDSLRVDVQYMKSEGRLGGYKYVEGKVPSRVRHLRYFNDYEDSDFSLYGGKVTWNLGPASLVIEGSNLKKDGDQLNDVSMFIGAPISGITLTQNFHPSTDQNAYELRVVSNSPSSGPALFANWNYVAGLFYMKADQATTILSRFNFPTFTRVVGGGGKVSSDEKAFYFDVTRNFGHWELNLGGRYFDEATRGKGVIPFVYNSTDPGGIPPTRFAFGDAQARTSQSGFNPKAAIRWFATDHATLVASYARGYRFGGLNSVPDPTVPTSYKSDEIDNYELGARTTWLDGRLTADLTAFYIDWKRLQILQRFGTLAYTYTANVGAAEIKGVEFALNAAPTPNWLLSVGGSYQDAKTAKFFNSAEWGPIEPGTRLGQAPLFTGYAQVRYKKPFARVEFDTTATYSYRSSARNNLINSIPLDAFGTVDLAASVQFKDMSLRPRLSLLGTNLTDKQAVLFGLRINNVDTISTNMPRQVMLKLDLAF